VNRVDEKLAKWQQHYELLKVARARLKEAMATPGPVPSELKDEVDRLHRLCGAALDELNAEYKRLKDGGDSQ
jgi:hypothetical protein